MNIMDKNYILHKYLNASATAEELEELKKDPEFHSYIKIAEASQAFETPLFKEGENLDAITKNRNQNNTKVRSLFPLKNFLRVAAVIVLVVASYLFITTQETSFKTEVAERKELVLPDQSEVILNAKSQLSYHKNDWKNERHLTLEGEAYFKVQKGEKFSVETPQGIVSVLGTQFNVFSRGDQFYVKCFEGLVAVAFKDTLMKVPAGNYLKIEKDKLISFEITEDLSPSWVAYESKFENTDLNTVLEELERQYSITVTHDFKLDTKFTGRFPHKDLNLALRTICEPLQLTFKITGNEVMLYAKNSN
jgi:transmembrane sensor